MYKKNNLNLTIANNLSTYENVIGIKINEYSINVYSALDNNKLLLVDNYRVYTYQMLCREKSAMPDR